ncbi:MAG: hypothetical protein IKK34_01440 [Clostridia bacterium]|nr:hypothetical protein [Clostridia bacterium]
MAKALKIAGEVYAAGLLIAALLFCFVHAPKNTSSAPPKQNKTGEAHAPAGLVNLSVLFPGLDVHAVTAVSISTHERSFEFRSDNSAVTVNGSAADSDIYRTLLLQIAELPVSALNALPAGASQILSLVVTTGTERHHAQFYGGTGAEAYIRCGTQHAPQYRQTDGWRVGTLMMTCEGARMEPLPHSTAY